jgi:uncharacterized protein
MSSFGITKKTYTMLLELFNRHPEVEEVWLFGSRAKSTHKKGSDIDLTIKGENCNPDLALTIANQANEELPIPYQVDVVDYSSIDNPNLKEHIDRVGKLFYSKSKETAEV